MDERDWLEAAFEKNRPRLRAIAYRMFAGKPWVVDNLADYGVPRGWWPWLGIAKALGALGLVVGIWMPGLGAVAAGCLTAYFVGAVVTVLRAGRYSHVPFPLLFLAPVVVAGVVLSWRPAGSAPARRCRC